MKNFTAVFAKMALVLILPVVVFSACNSNEAAAPGALDRDTSYAFGMFIAAQAGLTDMDFDYQGFMEGFRDFNQGGEEGTRFSMDEAFEKIIPALTQLQAEMDERMWLEGEINREEGEDYLAQNRTRSGVNVTASGLQYEVIEQGSGERPGSTDMVQVHYEGSLIDGTVFDSSYQRGSPVEFPLDAVIPGWSEGVQLMNEGSTFRFVIPSDLAYGPAGAGGSIPPHSTLIFRVELLSIIR